MKIYYKRPQLILRIILISFLLLLSRNAHAIFANTQQDVTSIVSGVESSAKFGLEAFEKVLKSKSMEKKDTILAWEELNEKHITSFQNSAYVKFESLLMGKPIGDVALGPMGRDGITPSPLPYKKLSESEIAKAREWAKDISAFFDDIQTCGEVADWQRKVNTEIFGLKFDTEMAPVWIDLQLSVAKEHSHYLTSLAKEIKNGSLSSAEIQKHIDEVKKIRNYTENISNCLMRRVEYLEKQHTMKAEMDKRVTSIIAIWGDIKARHPKVNPDLTSIPPTWVPLVKKHWEDYKDVKKKFDEAYGPLMAGKLFKDVAFFKDKSYGDLASPVISLENELRRLLSLTYK